MSLLLETSVSLTRSWCSAYTRGLSDDERAERRAEIESDLWEHQRYERDDGRPRADVGFDILVRFVMGIPADIAWRRSAGLNRRASAPARGPAIGRGRKMATRLFATFSAGLAVVLGVFLLFNAVGIFLEGDYIPYALIQVISGGALIASVPVGARSPRKAAALVAAAAIVFAAVHIWMAVIVLPVALILVGGAWLRNRPATPPVPQT